MEDGFLDATSFLLAVVVEQAEGIASQQDDSHKVASRQEGHEEVDDVPHQLEAGKGTEDDHQATRTETIDCHHLGIRRDEADVGLAIVIVADDAVPGAADGTREDGQRLSRIMFCIFIYVLISELAAKIQTFLKIQRIVLIFICTFVPNLGTFRKRR